MDEKNGKNSFLALTVATLLFAALGVIVYTQAPFKGTRPSVPSTPESSEKIRARLWQDPFQAVLDGVKVRKAGQPDQVKDRQETEEKKAKAPGKPMETKKEGTAFCMDLTLSPAAAGRLVELQKDIEKKINKNRVVTVLGVMVQGGPYDDDLEFRICQRYAVLSGLDVLGLQPEDPTHIDYLRICPASTPQQGNEPATLLNIIPFEWLESDEQQTSVLLLWLNELSFKETPLGKLNNLRDKLTKIKNFRIIGPATSTILLDMINEDYNGPELEIYSPTATADPEILLKTAAKNKGGEAGSLSFPSNIHRTINTDKELFEELVKELRNRDVDLFSPRTSLWSSPRQWVCREFSHIKSSIS